ncbi:hypothetical protein TWF696_009639 [Orbilia brochopaga]|uniref:Uncharacterized protein n=1 Tax=Orbilia brochopaga TaxID=3140254 RepID=A0AAV9UE72_9PEZI
MEFPHSRMNREKARLKRCSLEASDRTDAACGSPPYALACPRSSRDPCSRAKGRGGQLQMQFCHVVFVPLMGWTDAILHPAATFFFWFPIALFYKQCMKLLQGLMSSRGWGQVSNVDIRGDCRFVIG